MARGPRAGVIGQNAAAATVGAIMPEEIAQAITAIEWVPAA